MTDVVAVGLTTAGSSLVVAVIGAVTTYKVNSRTAGAAIATARSQNEMEMARIEAENSRLRNQYAEDERRNRQATYHNTLSTLQSIYALDGPDDDNLDLVAAEWRNCRAGVNIFGSESASEAVDEAHGVIQRFLDRDTESEAWEKDLGEAMRKFISAVRADIGIRAGADAQVSD